MLKSNEICQLNEANLVLRHFVDLSARLLPFLSKLTDKEVLTKREVIYKGKIMEVYENYNFDPITSEALIDSNILELINTTYQKIAYQNDRKGKRTLRKFLFEHQRLVNSWNYSDAN